MNTIKIHNADTNTTQIIPVKFIPNTNERYSVSRTGRVFSYYHAGKGINTKRANPLELKPSIVGNGYLAVNICAAGEIKLRKLHALVAETYMGSRPAGYEIDHMDGNKLNNSLANLRYVTKSQNLQNQKNSKNYTFCKVRQKFKVYFLIDGILKHFGYYKTEEEAQVKAAILREELGWYCPSKRGVNQ